MDWAKLLHDFGWPTAILVLIGIVVYKALWPRIILYLDDQRQIAEDARKALINRAEKLEEREDTVLGSFRDILQSSANRDQKQIEVLDEIATLVRDTNIRIRKGI